MVLHTEGTWTEVANNDPPQCLRHAPLYAAYDSWIIVLEESRKQFSGSTRPQAPAAIAEGVRPGGSGYCQPLVFETRKSRSSCTFLEFFNSPGYAKMSGRRGASISGRIGTRSVSFSLM